MFFFCSDLISGAFVLPSMVHNALTTIDYNRQVYNVTEVSVFVTADETSSAEASFFGVMGIVSSITAVLR